MNKITSDTISASYIFKCSFCNSFIYLYNNVLSSRGKRLSLDIKTNKPHRYREKEIHDYQEEPKILKCKHCDKDIPFSPFEKSKTGKMIQLNHMQKLKDVVSEYIDKRFGRWYYNDI